MAFSQTNRLNPSGQVAEVTAVDTYIAPGTPRNTLVYANRDAFFQKHPNLAALLNRASENPLLEEGKYNDSNHRDRNGEHFLTYETIELFIEHEIRQHIKNENGLAYDNSNIFVIDNNLSKVLSILSDWKERQDNNIKIIHITEIHAIAIYLKKTKNGALCFIVDSEGIRTKFPNDLVDVIRQLFCDADIYLSDTVLQKDFYSCATFAIKTIKYFVKHGNEIAPYLFAKNDQCTMVDNCYVLNENDLMPPLLKMCQSKVKLSDTALDTIVSYKSKTTLRAYWQKYNVGDKNSSALIKKYEFLTKLSRIVSPELKIYSDINIKLPLKLTTANSNKENKSSKKNNIKLLPLSLKKIYHYVFENWADVKSHIPTNLSKSIRDTREKNQVEDIKKFFFTALNKDYTCLIQEDSRNKFRVALRTMGSKHLESLLFGNAIDELKGRPYHFPDDNSILKHFMNENKKFKYYPNNINIEKDVFKQFKKYFQTSKIIADFVERNNDDNDTVPAEHAYKLIVLFGNDLNPFQPVDEYLKLYNFYKTSKPLHDALVHPIPVFRANAFTLKSWQKLIVNNGPRVVKIFSLAQQIEQQLKESPKTYEQALEILKNLSYKNAAKYPDLANACVEYKISEETFESCLNIKENHKRVDNVPDLHIDGEVIDEPQYHLVKLPASDPRGYILGHITNCCQSIDGHSKQCVIDGMTLKSNGFYVLLKTKTNETNHVPPKNKDGSINYDSYEIVGQGYVWLSSASNFTFDSWENRSPDRDNVIASRLLYQFAKKITHSSQYQIERITIGRGGKTPRLFAETQVIESILEGKQYQDSMSQYQIYSNLEKSKPHLANLTSLIDHFLISQCSAALAENIKLCALWIIKSCTLTHIILKTHSILENQKLRGLLYYLLLLDKKMLHKIIEHTSWLDMIEMYDSGLLIPNLITDDVLGLVSNNEKMLRHHIKYICAFNRLKDAKVTIDEPLKKYIDENVYGDVIKLTKSIAFVYHLNLSKSEEIFKYIYSNDCYCSVNTVADELTTLCHYNLQNNEYWINKIIRPEGYGRSDHIKTLKKLMTHNISDKNANRIIKLLEHDTMISEYLIDEYVKLCNLKLEEDADLFHRIFFTDTNVWTYYVIPAFIKLKDAGLEQIPAIRSAFFNCSTHPTEFADAILELRKLNIPTEIIVKFITLYPNRHCDGYENDPKSVVKVFQELVNAELVNDQKLIELVYPNIQYSLELLDNLYELKIMDLEGDKDILNKIFSNYQQRKYGYNCSLIEALQMLKYHHIPINDEVKRKILHVDHPKYHIKEFFESKGMNPNRLFSNNKKSDTNPVEPKEFKLISAYEAGKKIIEKHRSNNIDVYNKITNQLSNFHKRLKTLTFIGSVIRSADIFSNEFFIIAVGKNIINMEKLIQLYRNFSNSELIYRMSTMSLFSEPGLEILESGCFTFEELASIKDFDLFHELDRFIECGGMILYQHGNFRPIEYLNLQCEDQFDIRYILCEDKCLDTVIQKKITVQEFLKIPRDKRKEFIENLDLQDNRVGSTMAKK